MNENRNSEKLYDRQKRQRLGMLRRRRRRNKHEL